MSETLSPQEAAYFETRGNADPVATPPEVTPEPAPQVETPQTEAPVADKTPTVPPEQHPAVVAERERRRAAEKANRENEARIAALEARYEERLRAIQEAQAPKPQAPQPPPDFAQDPEGFIKTNFGVTRQEIENLKAWQVQQFRQQQQQQQLAELQQWGRAQESSYVETAPDYNKAADYLRQSRERELTELGINDPVMRQQAIAQDVLAIAIEARRTGGSLPERIYKLAQLRGYAPPAATPTPTESPASNLETVAKGQAMSNGLRSSGSAPPSRLTVDALLKMSPEEFEKVANSADVRNLMGA